MKKYFNYTVKKAVSVKNLVTLEYLNLSPSFTYPQEVHDFYEFAYVDSGSLVCQCDNQEIVLNKNDFFLISPSVSHGYLIKKDKTASVFIVCFNCKSDILSAISGISTLDATQKDMVSKILAESQKAFQFPFDKKLVLLKNPVFGAQQLIESTIEELLISLVRLKISKSTDIKMVNSDTELKNSLVEDVINLLKENLESELTLDDVCKKTFYSKTYLNNLFKKHLGMPIMRYYVNLKINQSKKLLKEEFTISEISEKLCFGSPNYFSKVFKHHVGSTPSEYKNSIR